MEGPCDLVTYSYEDLKSITGEFSSENFIGNSHFGKLYCGKIQDALDIQEVIVKIWVDSPTPAGDHELQQSRFKNEIKLLTDSDLRSHPNMIKLMGYCYENGHLGVVYKQKPLDTLFNMLYRDELKWMALVKVAFTFAFLLKQFQDGGLWLRNIDAAYLLVDQASNPILFDFSTLVGGEFGPVPPSENIKTDGCFNLYTVDPNLRMTGQWTGQSDVFSYGYLLVSMFAKRRFEPDVDNLPVHAWAMHEYRERKGGSLAHTSFETDPLFDADDGLKITKLAMQCLDLQIMRRPTMDDVIDCFRDLKLVKRHSNILGMPLEQVSAAYPPLPNPKEKAMRRFLGFFIVKPIPQDISARRSTSL